MWDHVLRAPAAPKTVVARASAQLRLAHARAGYGFERGAAAARYAARGNARAEAEYAAAVLPRVPEACGPRADAPRCAPAAAYDLCWCRDKGLEAWLPKYAEARGEFYPGEDVM